MANQMVFRRHELKYMLSTAQYIALKEQMQGYMQLDTYGLHGIDNVYFDTPNYLLIRRSIEKPCYKEKLRLRRYTVAGQAQEGAFLELKKKYKGIVYKRRLHLSTQEANSFLTEGKPLAEDSQIAREIAYFVQRYDGLGPMVNLRYQREAYFGLADGEFRMTFDHDVQMQSDAVSPHAQPVLPPERVLLEIKTAQGLPEWLVAFLSEHKIYKTSFSKYGTAYTAFLLPQQRKERLHVS